MNIVIKLFEFYEIQWVPLRLPVVGSVPMQQALSLPLFDETVPYRRAIVLLLKEKCERSRGFAVSSPRGCEGERERKANICGRGEIGILYLYLQGRQEG
jgi:hypothetical protein